MATSQSFGRRAVLQPQRKPALALPAAQPAVDEPAATMLASANAEPEVDHELDQWKRERSFRIPWRQLSLMASLCFGLASFVLPDSVNANVDWVLYGLSAMSLYVWFTNRRAKT